ncbi:hypothetical protein JW949_02940 [Candidatus Woesearchaeota archaeon]|nr:hypothetical protein [Candidatus Woesearchaeota archaeon]
MSYYYEVDKMSFAKEFLEELFLYIHTNNLRESVIEYNNKQVIVAQKIGKTRLFISEKTGEEVTFEQTQSGKYGKAFRVDYKDKPFVFVPGYVEKLKFKENLNGHLVSKINKLIGEPEKPKLEKKIRDLGYKGDIVYRNAEDFI